MSKLTELKSIEYTRETMLELQRLYKAGYCYYTAKRGEINKPVKWYKTAYYASQAVQRTLSDLHVEPEDELIQCSIANAIQTIGGIVGFEFRKNLERDLTTKEGYSAKARLGAIGNQLVSELKDLHDYMYQNRGLKLNERYSAWANKQRGKLSRELRDMITVKLYNNRLGINVKNITWLCEYVRAESKLVCCSGAAQSRLNLLKATHENNVKACSMRALKAAAERGDIHYS